MIVWYFEVNGENKYMCTYYVVYLSKIFLGKSNCMEYIEYVIYNRLAKILVNMQRTFR